MSARIAVNLACCALALAAAVPAARAEPSKAYDLLRERYAPFTAEADPFGFPMKVRSVSSDPYKFWRGTKDLFFAWCGEHARDWLDERGAYVWSHGDPHVGNLGTYAAAGDDGAFGTLAFGLVDFDDAAELPFQLDLLQGAITFDLLADANGIELSADERELVMRELLTAYRAGLSGGRPARDAVRDARPVAKLLGERGPYEKLLAKHLGDGDRFLPVIRDKSGEPKELLLPCRLSHDELADALAQAVANDAGFRGAMHYESAGEFAPAIVRAVRRVRLGSSGSQGLAKYLVLLHRPLRASDHDAIVYLKEQIPSAAERAGAIDRRAGSAGRRCAEAARALTDPPPFASSWCEVGGKSSFAVTLREPWSDELEPDDVKSSADLLAYARIWGVVVGAAHARAGGASRIAPSLDVPRLVTDLRARAAAYRARLDADFKSFTADPRVNADVARAASAVSQFADQQRP